MMETLAVTIFFLALLAAMASCLAMWKFMLEARHLIEQEGGNGLPMFWGRPPIDVRRLRGAPVIPARKSNKWALICTAFVLFGFWSSLLTAPLTPIALVIVGFATIFAIGSAIHIYRITWPHEPGDGAKPRVSA